MSSEQLLGLANEIKRENKTFNFNKRSKKNTKESVYNWYKYPINNELYTEFYSDVPDIHKGWFDKGMRMAAIYKDVKEDIYNDDITHIKKYMTMSVWGKRGYYYFTREYSNDKINM